jgi:hypothetical protein
MQEIPFHHGLKPGANIVAPLFELRKPCALVQSDEFQDMVLDRIEPPHLCGVCNL